MSLLIKFHKWLSRRLYCSDHADIVRKEASTFPCACCIYEEFNHKRLELSKLNSEVSIWMKRSHDNATELARVNKLYDALLDEKKAWVPPADVEKPWRDEVFLLRGILEKIETDKVEVKEATTYNEGVKKVAILVNGELVHSYEYTSVFI